MKTYDIQMIYETAGIVIDNAAPLIGNELSRDKLQMLLLNVYINNDLTKECTTRFLNFGTIITTRTKVSMILDTKVATHAGNSTPLCSYNSLTDDLLNILTWIDYAFARVSWK